NVKNLQPLELGRRAAIMRLGREALANRKNQANRRALAQFAINLDFPFVPFHDAINHCQTETSASPALRGKERFEATLAGLLVHTDTVISDFQNCLSGNAATRRVEIPAANTGPD